jgi:dTDP-4-amino-4,6-dideoxygalactose transaminase
MKVPLLDLKAQFASIEADVRAAVDRVLRSQRFILGPEVEQLERQVAERTGVAAAVGVSSGTDALLCALMAAEVGPQDEVIVPTFSFFATVGVVARLGATPVLVDVDPVTYNADPEAVARAVTPRTRAIVVVHLFGQCADMDPVLDVARRHGLTVIEDAAQALGATYQGRPAGSLGDYGCFSFFPSKNLGAYGDAGMIVTRDEQNGARCRQLRQHGARPKYHHPLLGGNFRIDALQAAVLNAKLPYLAGWSAARWANAARYDRLLAGSNVRTPTVAPYNESVYHQYVVRVAGRDDVRAALSERGIGTEVYYPEPLHLQPCLASLGYAEGDLPVAETVCREVLALPIYPELTPEQLDYVAEQVRAVTMHGPAPCDLGDGGGPRVMAGISREEP